MSSTTHGIEKFQKGSFYEDTNGEVYYCTNGRQRKTPDGHYVVDMKTVREGKPVGRAEEEYTDTFVRKLTKAEVKERAEIDRREAEAEAEADAETEPSAEEETATKEKKRSGRKKKDGMSAIDAAAKVLSESEEPMTTKEMIEAMAEKGYWKSPGGQTPHATLYSAILREINTKGEESRFQKVERGKFALNE